jgi:hypothetical protein
MGHLINFWPVTRECEPIQQIPQYGCRNGIQRKRSTVPSASRTKLPRSRASLAVPQRLRPRRREPQKKRDACGAVGLGGCVSKTPSRVAMGSLPSLPSVGSTKYHTRQRLRRKKELHISFVAQLTSFWLPVQSDPTPSSAQKPTRRYWSLPAR